MQVLTGVTQLPARAFQQRVHVPAAIDVFRVGLLGQIEAVQHGWLRWVGSIAARHPEETDLWIDPSPPHALLAPRLVPHASLPASSAPALDPNGTYLITGGTGGVPNAGGAKGIGTTLNQGGTGASNGTAGNNGAA
jgi:hypothetical protein